MSSGSPSSQGVVVGLVEAKHQKPRYSSYVLAHLQDIQAQHTTRFINPIQARFRLFEYAGGGSDVFVYVFVKGHA